MLNQIPADSEIDAISSSISTTDNEDSQSLFSSISDVAQYAMVPNIPSNPSIDMTEFEDTAIDKLFPAGRICESDLRALENQLDLQLGELFEKHNILVKKVRKDFYIWNAKESVWKCSEKIDTGAVLKIVPITLINLIKRAVRNKQMHVKTAIALKKKLSTAKSIRGIKSFISYEHRDDEFDNALDRMDTYFPIKNGQKINIRTKEITQRNINDRFTFELNVTYLPHLADADNEFAKFLRTIWTEDESYEWFRLMNGSLMIPDDMAHNNLLILWHHKMGGGGKTVWINCLHEALTKNMVQKLPKRTLLTKGTGKNFSLSTLKNKLIAYVDETTLNEDSKANETIDLPLILDITGGGFRSEADKYQKESDIEPTKSTATLILLGNSNFFKKYTGSEPLKRRLLYCTSKMYFRDQTMMVPNDPYCKPKDRKLVQRLMNNLDHVFTFLVNAAVDYRASQPDLHALAPKRFLNEFNRYNRNPDKLAIFKQFITLKTRYVPDNKVLLKEFRPILNAWSTTQYNIKFIQNELFEYVRHISTEWKPVRIVYSRVKKNKQDNVMEHGIDHPNRMRYITNIIMK